MNAGALTNTRLADFARVSTASVDDAAEAIGRIFCPHELKPICHSEHNFSAQHNCAAFDGFSVNYVAYGGSVSIDPGCLDRFFLLQIPLHGCAEIRTAAREVTTAPGAAASLLSPTVPTQMTWRQDCAQLILLLDRKLVEHRAAALGVPRRERWSSIHRSTSPHRLDMLFRQVSAISWREPRVLVRRSACHPWRQPIGGNDC